MLAQLLPQHFEAAVDGLTFGLVDASVPEQD